MATHCHKSEGNGEKLREEHELVVHDGGRDDGHNDDAINDSGGSGNMVVMGETLEKPTTRDLSICRVCLVYRGNQQCKQLPTIRTQDQGLIFYKFTCYRRVIKGSLELKKMV